MFIIGSSMVLSYAYGTIFCMLFFSKALERRYSYKITGFAAAFLCIVQCLVKIPVVVYFRVPSIIPVNGFIMFTFFAYQAFFFRGVLVKRVLSMAFYYLYLHMAEVISLECAYLITGEYGLMQSESDFTVLAIFIMLIMLTLFFYPLECLWNLLLRVEGHKKWHLWLCVLLPLSQYIWFEYLIDSYEIKQRNIPACMIWGMALGVLADFYMFFLFYRQNQQEQAEQALLCERDFYRREQIYYENLRESQEEAARLRHDFQNYIQTLENMTQKGGVHST